MERALSNAEIRFVIGLGKPLGSLFSKSEVVTVEKFDVIVVGAA